MTVIGCANHSTVKLAEIKEKHKGIAAYKRVMADLEGYDKLKGIAALYKQWDNLGNESVVSLSEAKNECIEEQDLNNGLPSKNTMIVQILNCMRDKGWQLKVETIYFVS